MLGGVGKHTHRRGSKGRDDEGARRNLRMVNTFSILIVVTVSQVYMYVVRKCISNVQFTVVSHTSIKW